MRLSRLYAMTVALAIAVTLKWGWAGLGLFGFYAFIVLFVLTATSRAWRVKLDSALWGVARLSAIVVGTAAWGWLGAVVAVVGVVLLEVIQVLAQLVHDEAETEA
jgi:hypothetical protein